MERKILFGTPLLIDYYQLQCENISHIKAVSIASALLLNNYGTFYLYRCPF